MHAGKLNDETRMKKGILHHLSTIFEQAVALAFPDIVDILVPVAPSSRPQFGDYQCNAAMPISNALKNRGIKIDPMNVASKILEYLKTDNVVEKVDVVAPGFLNIWVSKAICKERIFDLILNGIQPPPLDKVKTVVVDFSSPNIAKEMHVGHLRSTIIGDSICRLLEFMGHDVLRINHVGDWGTQFGMLIAHLKEKFPDYLTKSPPIHDLQSFYKESKSRFDSDSDFKSKAYACVIKLQNLDPEYMKAWNLICDVSRKEFQKIYNRLDIVIEERGESFYQRHMVELVRDLETRGFLEYDEGRKVMFGLEADAIPLTIVKSDGGFTYDTSDLAAIQYRIQQDHATWIIYVTDAGQATHFKVIQSCAEKAGILNRSLVKVVHVGFGVVLGEDKKKFKTRSGETVKLQHLLDEGLRRAEEKLKEKNRHTVLTQEELDSAKEAIAYGCIKYADLSHNRINDYVFSFDAMLEDKGNTAVYLLYAYTRIRSIVRNAGIDIKQLNKVAECGDLTISHDREWKLIKVLVRFTDTILKVVESLSLHHLCEYVYEIATTFSEFYDVCYCIEKNEAGEIVKIDMGRMLLCEATARTIEKCLNILGIRTVTRM
ncbi:hypothetical protein AAG570_013345 [Ranatra chinensis]|uniref:Probable arginine--tRNA ligase, cytoplasmic n=1 Tax=Ranatra chinensis TaxID=642074 RepID=A0ABD0YSZ6_9HEMI